MDFVLLLLVLFVVLGSLVALEMRDLLSAVIAVGVAGLGLSILFLLLHAPDIAITQVVVEVVVVTVLILAAGRTQRQDVQPAPRRLPAVVAAAGGLLVLFGCIAQALLELPPFGARRAALPAAHYLQHAGAETGATNVVTAVILDYRGLDTLGEATVILAAIVGALVILRRPAREAAPAAPPQAAPAAAPELAEAHHG